MNLNLCLRLSIADAVSLDIWHSKCRVCLPIFDLLGAALAKHFDSVVKAICAALGDGRFDGESMNHHEDL